MPAQTPAVQASTTSLPPFDELFRESWTTFKQSFLNLFVLTAITFAISIVLFLIMGIIIFVAAGTTGLFAALSHGDTTALAATGVSMGLLFFLTFVVFCILFTIIIYAQAASMIMLVSDSANKPQIVPTIKNSFKFILPLVCVSIIQSLVVLGGLGLLIIPGLIFAILFVFSHYEVVLNGQSTLQSLRRSMYVVKSHFLDILIRLIVYVFLYFVLFFIVPRAFGTISPKFVGLAYVYSFIGSTLFGWFAIAYFVTIYKQATALTEKDKVSHIRWIGVLSFIGWIFFFIFSSIIITAFGSLMKNREFQKAVQKSSTSQYKYSGTSSGSEITQTEADTLADEVFTAVNDYRSVKGLEPFEQDMRLCAYAQRRLEQLSTLGKFDDYKGYYEDMANKDMNNAYFKNYQTLNEYVHGPLDNHTNANMIVSKWTMGTALEENKAIVASKSFNNACVRANPEFIVIEGGKK